ncbi:CopG family transcriptional regulator [Limosilactobacillus oris]|uniref:ribbon-helix-helix domain-containing protein n=1 Tax=Limosilactobacillus oris TaxID=1632 RepID=UPI0019592502|nr:CopG family transcriptional regulator [Limosilactobacillus oris]VTX69486.1 Uncharacterised protein [Limosilactobacillus oris]
MVKGLKEVHVYLDDEKNLRLLSLAKQENISKKELVERIIDEYLVGKEFNSIAPDIVAAINLMSKRINTNLKLSKESNEILKELTSLE